VRTQTAPASSTSVRRAPAFREGRTSRWPDTRGTPLLDFDVSYLDDAYLRTLKADVFNDRLTKFLTDGNWSRYAAYAPLNWTTPDECPSPTGRPSNPNKTSFSCLVARTDRVPSANILITDAQTGSAWARWCRRSASTVRC